MEHNLCRENLSAYLDGELPRGERLLVEEHLAGCPACRAELAQLGEVSGLVKKHGLEPVPPALKGAVLGDRLPAARPWLKPVLALSAAAAGVLVIMNVTQPPEDALYSPSLGFGSRESADISVLQASAEAEPAAANETAPAAPAPAADPLLFPGTSEKRKITAVSTARGAYGQAKFSGARGTLSAGAARPAVEFSGKVCVYLSDPSRAAEPVPGTAEALSFLAGTGTRLASAAPGSLAFVKEDGSRLTLREDRSGVFIFFDGARAPLAVTDPAAVPARYEEYFGAAAGSSGK